MIGAKRFQAMVENMYGDARIEDQWLRYYAVACSLTHGTSRVLKSGPFWRRVGASMSIPGVGPPVCEKGELLVDGGVLMNLPIEPMRSFCEGRVIAVSVSPPVDASSIELLEFKALDRAVEIGYRHTVERLEQWQAAGQRMPA